MTLFLFNVVMALAWAAWQGRIAIDTMTLGFLLSLGLLRLCLPLYPQQGEYFRRSWNFVLFLGIFSREMWNSTKAVAITVFSVPVKDLHPSLVTLNTKGLSGFELLLLTHCITLTPGTTSIDVAEDKTWILVHALDGRKPVEVRKSIEGALRDSILRFTR